MHRVLLAPPPLCSSSRDGRVMAQRLYDLERALCTYDHTVLLNNPTHYCHLLERWRRRFGIFIIRVNLLNLPNLASCQVYPLLHYPYDLNISTSKCMEALPNFALLFWIQKLIKRVWSAMNAPPVLQLSYQL